LASEFQCSDLIISLDRQLDVPGHEENVHDF
jgi:hypothetical protein